VKMSVPKYDDLFNPLLKTMKELGSSATISELDEAVIKRLHLTDKEIAEQHGDSNKTELQYQLAWTRTYLKVYGLIDNSERGIWVLTPKGKEINPVDPDLVLRKVQELQRDKRNILAVKSLRSSIDVESHRVLETIEEETEEEIWREELLTELLNISPDAFERLCQRLLRESGFVEVKVTGRSGDGGIDGVGIVRLGGLLGFPILFQCKRYSGSVGSSVIRDFRGAMMDALIED
jgi:restriction system protein